MANAAVAEKHPRGLYVLFSSEMWERYSFYTVNAMLALYLRDTVQGFGFTNAEATGVSAWYLAAVYASPLFGGLIADLFLGFRKSIIVGACFFIAGHALLGVPGSIGVVYAALACLVIGNGFFKPNVSSMVGNLYPEGSHLKDKAYLIFYMGINIGATLAPIIAGFVQPKWGFHPAFFLGAVGMIISLIVFISGTKHVRHADRVRGKSDFNKANGSKENQEAVATSEDLPPVMTEGARTMAAVPEWKRIMALIVVYAIVIVFWMIFHQNSLTLTFWADDHTRWTFIEAGGILSNAINPLFIIIFSLPLAAFWTWLDKRGLEPSTPTKMMYGMTLTGLSMLVLYFASQANGFTSPAFRVVKVEGGQTYVQIAKEARDYLKITMPPTKVSVMEDNKPVEEEAWPVTVNGGAVMQKNDFVRIESHTPTSITTSPTTKASLAWLLLLYAVISLAELMLSPMGLSLVSKVAPVRWRGLMMGGWFLATAIGNKLTAIGVYWDRWSHAQFFLTLAIMAWVMAVVLFVLLRPLKKAMPGV